MALADALKFLRNNDIDRARRALAGAMESGKFHFEFVCSRPDGEECLLEATGVAVKSLAASKTSLLGTLRDISRIRTRDNILLNSLSNAFLEGARSPEEWSPTRRDNAGNQLQSLEDFAFTELVDHADSIISAVAEVVPAAVLIAHDRDCKVMSGNSVLLNWLQSQHGLQIFKIGKDSRLAHKFQIFSGGRRLPAVEWPLQTAINTGKPVNGFELDILRPDRALKTIYGNASPSFDDSGEVCGGIAAFVDITQLKAIQSDLRASRLALENLIGVVSHEIMNPLVAIKLVSESLRSDATLERIRESRETISGAADFAAHLINDLGDAGKLKGPLLEIKLSPIDIVKSLDLAIKITNPLAKARNVILRCSLPALPMTVYGDSTRFTQLFENLLDNAMKYTPAGGVVEAKLSNSNGSVQICIEDTGIGISDEQLPRLFDLFWRGNELVDGKLPQGLGIGLSLAKHIVTELNGSIHVARKEDKETGTIVTVTFPLHRG